MRVTTTWPMRHRIEIDHGQISKELAQKLDGKIKALQDFIESHEQLRMSIFRVVEDETRFITKDDLLAYFGQEFSDEDMAKKVAGRLWGFLLKHTQGEDSITYTVVCTNIGCNQPYGYCRCEGYSDSLHGWRYTSKLHWKIGVESVKRNQTHIMEHGIHNLGPRFKRHLQDFVSQL